MQTACSTTSYSLSVVLRRSLLLAGFLLGFGLVALVSAGTAHADEQDRSSQTRGEAASSGGLLGGLLEPVTPVVSSVAGVTDPVLSGVSRVAAPVVTPVVAVVEPVTAPLLRPVTEPLSPVLEVLAPVTGPLLGPAEPVVTPVARGLGVEPQALGVDPARTVPVAPVPVQTTPDVGVTIPAAASPPVQPAKASRPVAVDIVGPLRTAVATRPAASHATSSDAVDSQWHGRSARRPMSPGPDLAVLAGATGTASSGGNAGGASGQADLLGYQGVGPNGGVDVVAAQRWLVPPWCYVFGRHHPS